MSSSLREEGHPHAGHFQKTKHERAEHRERHGAEQNDQRIAEAVELRGEHEENQHDRQQECGQKFISFDAQLPRLAGVIDLITVRQNFFRFGFQKRERLIERNDGDAGNLHRVELLETIERTRHGFVLRSWRTCRAAQLVRRAAHVNVPEAGRDRGARCV